MRLKSLELNWIRKQDKSLVIPEVIFFPLKSYGGQYMRPQYNEVYDDEGHPHDMKFGAIIISSLFPDNVAGTIAHEWRHHWQTFNGWKYDGIGWHSKSNYYKEIYNYFTKSKSEMDALKFEHRHVGCFEPWEKMFYKHLKD